MPSSVAEVRVADHFEEVIGLRVSALEVRVATEAEAVKEHFAELQSFITFSLARQSTELREEIRREIGRLDGRIDRLEQRFDKLELRFDVLEQRFDRLELRVDRLEQRFDGLERKFDAHHEAIKLILGEILDRLPARHA